MRLPCHQFSLQIAQRFTHLAKVCALDHGDQLFEEVDGDRTLPRFREDREATKQLFKKSIDWKRTIFTHAGKDYCFLLESTSAVMSDELDEIHFCMASDMTML